MSAPAPPVPYENSYWVVPGLFLAGEHPDTGFSKESETRLAALFQAGIRVFIDLTEEHEAASYALILQCLAEERNLDLTCLRIPVRDRTRPSASTLRCVLGIIDQSITEKRPVLVHCFGGIGRTGTIVGCYLRRHRLATGENVMEQIAELRRAMPIAAEVSPHVPEQIEAIVRWPDGA